MLVRKEQRREKKIAKEGIIWEYDFPSKTLGFALARLNGRVPDSGRFANTTCSEIYYVIGGSGTVFIEDEKYEVKEGDMLLIEPGKRYYTIGRDLQLALPTSPPWYPEQRESSE